MRLFRGRVEGTANEILKALVKAELIEVAETQAEEVQKDIESVMYEYIRVEREITERSKDIASRQGLDFSAAQRIRRSLAKDKHVGIEDETLDYVVRQIIEMLESSRFVEEVFGEDHDLNRAIAPIVREQMASPEDQLGQEIDRRMRHLKDAEGSIPWEIEYQRIKSELERLKKLD
ncbi:MAG: DUF507 family protein [Deltaproteobacteria bacterium]|nr:DUF507 family protein [Deltaproteobacteria bacterium]